MLVRVPMLEGRAAPGARGLVCSGRNGKATWQWRGNFEVRAAADECDPSYSVISVTAKLLAERAQQQAVRDRERDKSPAENVAAAYLGGRFFARSLGWM